MAKAIKKSVVKKSPVKKTLKKTATKKTVKKAAVKAVKKSAAKKSSKKKKEDLMCFLTTACVHQYGLADTCFELNTLRRYRDTFLMKTEGGKKLVREYYNVAPHIVKRLYTDPLKEQRFLYIYSQIDASCEAIEKQKLNKAEKIYKNMVLNLRHLYAI